MATQLPAINHVVMHLTGKCNLGCSYCFQGEHDNWFAKDMEPETARSTVDFLIANSGENQSIQIGFFGGEPTLKPDLLEMTCEYARTRAAEVGKSVSFSITTNMTLINDRLIEIIKRYGIGVLGSIDGIPRPSNVRFYKGTTLSSAQKAYDNLLRLRDEGIIPTLRWTLTPLTTGQLMEDVTHFAEQGFRNLAVEFVYETPWDEGDVKRLEVELRKLQTFYIAELRAGRDLYCKPIDDGFQVYTMDERPNLRCGLAYQGAGIGTDGKVHPCHRYSSREDHASWEMGDVFNGFTEARVDLINSWDGNAVKVSDGRSCHDCPVKIRCSGGICLPVNLDTTGELNTVPSWHCEIQLACQRVANDVLGILYGERNPLMVAKLEGSGGGFGGNTEGMRTMNVIA